MTRVPTYSPMQPTLVREPFHRPGWVYEEKVDGYRILAYKGLPTIFPGNDAVAAFALPHGGAAGG
jgi:hypothetical protein